MKSVMRISLVLFLSLFVTGAFAQQRGMGQGMRNQDPEAQTKMQVDQLKKIVKVDKKEEEKVKEIFLKSNKERQEKFSGLRNTGNREEMRAAIDELNKKRDEELKKVLGEKRMEKYLEEIAKLRGQRGGQRRF